VTSESSVRDKKVILTADPHRHTRTGRYKAGKLRGWEVRKLGIELKLEGESKGAQKSKLKVEDPPFFWRTQRKEYTAESAEAAEI
jgi:hypothetical protein